MHRIGFVGLGMMGGPMAANILRGGFDVVAFDQRSDAAGTLAEEGGRAAGSLSELAQCDAAVVMVNTDAQARDVVGALLDANPKPTFAILCMSTILPSSARELGERATAARVGFLDAPVSGGPVVAQFGALAIMAGGDAGLFERARPVFQAMGNVVRHVGEVGSGLAVKLVNNMIAIQTLPVVAESLRVGVEQGIELATLVDVIRESSGNTWITQNWDQAQAFLQLLLADQTQLESLLATGRKDLELARAFCAESGLAAPLLEQAIATLDARGADGLRTDLEAIVATGDRS
jgi:3-hydroxyisobutyrate dehydrogenase-like beta-hydroxyacid dehydrogenase